MELWWILRVKLSKMSEEMMNQTDRTQHSFLEDAKQQGPSAALLGLPEGCNDQIVGDILSGWRYDLTLLAVFTLSFFAFLLATAIIHREPWGQTSLASLHTRHLSFALTLQTAAMGGLLLSLLMWVLVAIATPAPLLIQTTMQQRRWATGRHRA